MLHPARLPRRHQLVRFTLAGRLKLSITQSCILSNLYLPDLSWLLTGLGDNDYQTVDLGPSQLLSHNETKPPGKRARSETESEVSRSIHKSQGFLDPLSSNLFLSGSLWAHVGLFITHNQRTIKLSKESTGHHVEITGFLILYSKIYNQ